MQVRMDQEYPIFRSLAAAWLTFLAMRHQLNLYQARLTRYPPQRQTGSDENRKLYKSTRYMSLIYMIILYLFDFILFFIGAHKRTKL